MSDTKENLDETKYQLPKIYTKADEHEVDTVLLFSNVQNPKEFLYSTP